MYPISATTFIKDAFKGGFPIFESMATFLALPIQEFVVLDMGSTDGTRELLNNIEDQNPRVRVVDAEWSEIDAKAFADVANQCVAECWTDNVLFYQADEIWHPNLLDMMVHEWQDGNFDLSFWRIQLKTNFHEIKWWPHPVHRCIVKGQSEYVGDGMNTNRTWDAKLCSTWNGGWFSKWMELEDHPEDLPWDEFIFDISHSFRDNAAGKAKLHAPFWHESGNEIDHMPAMKWLEQAEQDPRWAATAAPFPLPPILQGCVGMTKYYLRDELYEALLWDDTYTAIYEGEQ